MASPNGKAIWETISTLKQEYKCDLQERVKDFLRTSLGADEENLQGADQGGAEKRRAFYLNIESNLGMQGVADSRHPGLCADSWVDKTTTPVHDRSRRWMSWNVNGFKKRWKEGSIQQTLKEADYPDHLLLTET
jgi:hypothetical protein